MTGILAWHLLRKDLGVGPRSPIFLYAIVLPVILTLLIRVVFGSLFDPVPRLGIVDEGESQVVQNVRDVEGIQVTFPESAAALKTLVENNDLDGGLVLPAGFDGALQAGQMPNVQFFFGGQSLASNRVVLGVTMVDLIRQVAGSPAPIDVETITVGEGEAVPIVSRLLPLIVLMAVLIAGALTPATSLVEEKEKRTLTALLVTPTRLGDVLLGKGALGFILAMATGVVTLALNGALGANPAALLLVLVLATLMAAEVGLMLGSFAKDTKALYTIWKSGAIVPDRPRRLLHLAEPAPVDRKSLPHVLLPLASVRHRHPRRGPRRRVGRTRHRLRHLRGIPPRRRRPRPPHGGSPGCDVSEP